MPRSGGAALPRSCGRAFWSAERDMISQRQLRGLFPSRLPLAAGGSPWGLSRSLPAMLTTTSLGACLGRNYARPAEPDPKCTVPSARTQPGLPAPNLGCQRQENHPRSSLRGASRCPLRHRHPTGCATALHARRPRGELNCNGLLSTFTRLAVILEASVAMDRDLHPQAGSRSFLPPCPAPSPPGCPGAPRPPANDTRQTSRRSPALHTTLLGATLPTQGRRSQGRETHPRGSWGGCRPHGRVPRHCPGRGRGGHPDSPRASRRLRCSRAVPPADISIWRGAPQPRTGPACGTGGGPRLRCSPPPAEGMRGVSSRLCDRSTNGTCGEWERGETRVKTRPCTP